MKPARFRYAAARSVTEAVDLLSEHSDAAKLLAGGQSLVPMMNLRLSRPEILIDLNRIPEKDGIYVEQGVLRVEMLARQRNAERSELVRANLPILAEAISQIGHSQIRSRGTLVGSCCHADPSAEIPTVLAAVDGSVRLQGAQGFREVPSQDFFLGFFQTALAPDEVATDLVFPLPPAGTGTAFLEFARRHGDFAIVGVAALVTLGSDGSIERAALALAGVGPACVRVPQAEAFLTGKRAEPAAFAEGARLAAQEIEPQSDVQASEGYRRELARTLVERALAAAAARAVREVA